MEKKLVSLRACEDYNQEHVDACMEKVFEDIGFDTYPKHDEARTDIIQNIIYSCFS